MILLKPFAVVEYGPSHDEAMMILEKAGRTCYKSEGKSDGTLAGAEKFVESILKRGHESVIEHVSYTIRFTCDRGVTHELVRHRLCAFSQESTRYVDYTSSGNCQFIIPPWVNIEPGKHSAKGSSERPVGMEPATWEWLIAMDSCEELYYNLRNMGWSPQQARSVLPNSTKTEIVVTANAREWRHIIRMRTSKAAHPQMIEVMSMAHSQLMKMSPVLFNV